MIVSILILVFSIALFLFYLQTLCEKILRREFSDPYFQQVINAIQLEYPRLRNAAASNTSVDYSDARLALECDYMTLSYLLKNADRTRQHLSRRERILFVYFRLQIFSLSVRHALKLREGDAVLRSAAILQYLANLVGERLSVSSAADFQPRFESR